MPAKFFSPDNDLQSTLAGILEKTWETFPELAQNQVAVTWIVYEPPYRINTGGGLSAEEFWQYQPSGASYRGVELIEPASLVTLFYLVAAHVWLEQGMVQPSPDLEQALGDMITKDSSEATSYVVDVLSGTTSGPPIPPGPLATWESQRNIVNRYFQQLGWPELRAVNMNQKIWRDRPYGREQAFLGPARENRNLLTTEATARLLHSIVGGVSVSATRSQRMMDLLRQTVSVGIPQTAPVWFKGGGNERVNHSAAYVEAEGVHPYQLVIFTEGRLQDQKEVVVPFISGEIFKASQQAFQVAQAH
ncbi:MAG: serine hydrolase [Phormidesmis sp.]